jgi:curved DNA-binding protein CbpA
VLFEITCIQLGSFIYSKYLDKYSWHLLVFFPGRFSALQLMGNVQSHNPSHVRIYKNLLGIQNPQTRAEMIRTLLVAPEYVASFRSAGIYAHMLAYIAKVEASQIPPPLPGEMAMNGGLGNAQAHPSAPPATHTSLSYHRSQPQSASSSVTKGQRDKKALNYFQSCLEVLGLEEEVALTEDALKKAYKKAALRAHPDKGGNERDFEAITRAHAYLGEILLRVKGGRTKEGKVEAPDRLRDTREGASKEWEMVEPVRLNPKKLDMNLFNQMFEQTRIPDPEEDGYGDWLKGGDTASSTPNFGGKFNRDVFNRAFEEEAQKRQTSSAMTVRQPEALTLAPNSGVELGRTGGGGFTAAANANLKFTDLRNAYTSENMITNQVADVRVEARSFDQFSASRKQAPTPLTNHELAGIQAAEAAAAKREEQRRLRAAQEDSLGSQYFERMKRLVITNNPS